jgi:prepilin-type N-terminal cleavage/methylation domain-containing protein/prepilin-type processing-associated H-X9-DG protein
MSGKIIQQKSKLEQLAAKQFGYFTAKQAVSVGYVDRNHSYHLKNGNWEYIDRGLFRLPGYTDSAASLCCRWSLWSRNNAGEAQVVIGYDTALYYYNIIETEPLFIDLIAEKSFKKQIPDCCAVHWRSFKDLGIKDLGCISLTSPLQALRDIKEENPERPDLPLLASKATECGLITTIELEQIGLPSTDSPSQIVGIFDPSTSFETKDKGCVAKEIKMQPVERTSRRGWGGYSRAAFTLVELLVVIAIISILASLLLPMLGRARETARQIVCASQMRQLSVAFNLYLDDNRDEFGNLGVDNADLYGCRAWMDQYASYWLDKKNQSGDYNLLSVCPSDTSAWLRVKGVDFYGSNCWYQYTTNHGLVYFTYGINGRCFLSGTTGLPIQPLPRRTQFKNPSKAMDRVDGVHGYVWPSWEIGNPVYGVQYRHNGKATISFLDTHVKTESFGVIDNTYCVEHWK